MADLLPSNSMSNSNSMSIAKYIKSSCLPLPKADADASSWYSGVVLLTLILLAGSVTQNYPDQEPVEAANLRPLCDEIYVVGEGETLHTISDKCGDSFIVERNPHIHDPDDVFPGLVIKIIPNPIPIPIPTAP